MKENKQGLLKLYYLVFYMGIGIYTTYITLYLKGEGLNSSQIGSITGLGPLVSMAGLAFAGRIADRTGKLNLVLAASFILSAVCALVIPIFPVFIVLLVTNVLYTFCSSPLLQLSDGLAADLCTKQNKPFNKVKICGSIGYAFIILFSGYVLKAHVSYMFVILSAVFAVSALLANAVPDTRTVTKSEKAPYKELLSNRRLFVLYAANLLVYIPISYYNSFFPIYMQDFAPGRLQLVSWASFLALISEFPFLAAAHILCKKLGNRKLLLLSCALMTVRWAVLALAPNVAVAIAVNFLKGTSDIVFVYCSTGIINEALGDRLKGTGQAFLGILTYGLARIIGNWGGGVLTDLFGIRLLFLYSALFPIAAGVIILLFRAHLPNKKRTIH